jgi:hypothetical protein
MLSRSAHIQVSVGMFVLFRDWVLSCGTHEDCVVDYKWQQEFNDIIIIIIIITRANFVIGLWAVKFARK